MKPPAAIGRGTVARRLIVRLAATGSLLAFALVLTQMALDYRRDIEELDAGFELVEVSYLASIEEHAWLNDIERLDVLVEGIARLPHIASVAVIAPDGAILAAHGVEAADPLRRAFPLAHEYHGKLIGLGELTVTADLAAVRDVALRRVWWTLSSTLALLLALCALLYLMVHRLVTGRLSSIIGYADTLGRRGAHEAGTLDLGASPPADDLTELGRSLNRMRDELAQADEGLRSSEARFRELFDRSPVSLWEMDFSEVRKAIDEVRPKIDDFRAWLECNPDFVRRCASLIRIIAVNMATVKLHRAESAADLDRLPTIFTPATYAGFRLELEAIFEGRYELFFETEIRTLDGDAIDVIVHWNVPPAFRDSYARVLVSREDVSRLKAAQRSAEITLEKLMQANAELERFTFIASHDLQEPVRAVVSFSQLIERRLASDGCCSAETSEYLSHLRAAVERMQRQVAGLIDYARAGQPASGFGPVRLDDALEDAKARLADAIAESRASIFAEPLPTVWGDRGLLGELFAHLLDNTIKFRRAGTAPTVTISAARTGEFWRIRVHDDGIGIDPLYAGSVFEVFRRLHGPAQYAGAGIGLSICRRIVDKHGGGIAIDTSDAPGTTLVLSLPAITDDG